MDATQEMLTLGVCNLLGSCFKSMPTCGAFTRSAVSQASGVKTPFAGLYSAALTILALSLLTPYFYFIPTATLASVLVIAVMFMVSYKFSNFKINSLNNNFTSHRSTSHCLCCYGGKTDAISTLGWAQ